MTLLNADLRKQAFDELADAVLSAEAADTDKDHALWRIGDALITLCGVPGPNGVTDGSGEKIGKVAQRLRELKLGSYSVSYLRQLRLVANDFPPDARASASWAVHREARDSDTLARVTVKANRTGKPLTVEFVRKFSQQEKEKLDRQRAAPGDRPASRIAANVEIKQVRELGIQAAAAAAEATRRLSAVWHLLTAVDRRDLATALRPALNGWERVLSDLEAPTQFAEAAE
jgi:hypothetical protein